MTPAASHTHTLPLRGYEIIDHAHLHMNEMIAEVRRFAVSGEHGRLMEKAALFREFTAGHFAQEEVIMRGTGFAGTEAHLALHHALLRRIDSLIEGLRPGTSERPRMEAVHALERLLRDHEIRDDASFHDFYDRVAGRVADWDESLLVGIDWLDREHRDLFARLRGIDRDIAAGAATESIRSGLDGFVADVGAHFRHEEAALAERGGDLAERHRERHQALLKDLDDLLVAYDRHSSALLAVDYLKFWVIDHVRRVDRADFAWS